MRQRFYDDPEPEPPSCDECDGETEEREDPCGVDYVCKKCGYTTHCEDPRIQNEEWRRDGWG